MEYQGKSEKGKVTRRGFLKTTALLGTAAAATPGIFHILGRAALADTSVCRVLMTPTADLTPPLLKSGEGQSVAAMIYDWLVRLEGPDNKLTPSLAESFESSKDMTEWTFKLRENVKFHHGSPFTAEDVVYTAKRWTNPEVGGPMKTVFADLQDVVSKDKMVVTFKLKKPDPEFLLKLLEYNAPILSHDYDNGQLGNTKPSGTGAFKVKSLTPGQRIVMEKNPDYFVPGLPKVNQMEVIFIPEIQTQLMTLEAGQADVIRWVGYDSVLRYKDNAKVNLHSVEVANHGNFYMRVDQAPFNDNRVRLAIKHCIDRKMALEAAAYGYGVVGNDSPVWPKHPLYSDVGIRERNLDKAKQLLSDAGFAKGLDVDVYVPSNQPPLLDTALAMQQMLKPAGVNLQIQGVTMDVYYARYWLKVNCGITNWAHRESPVNLMNITLKTGVPWNESHFSSADLDRKLDEVSVEVDAAKRKAMVKDIEAFLAEEGPSVIPFFYNVFAATRKGVKGFQMARNMTHDYRTIEVS